MFAVIETGGKQYKVNEGDVLYVEKLSVNEGDKVTFDKVLAVSGSAVLLPAALTAQQRVADDHGYEQSYLAVSSAAALLRSGIAGEELCIRVTSRFGAEGTVKILARLVRELFA